MHPFKNLKFLMAHDEMFPALPFNEWEATKNTLHLFAQIVGKVRLYHARPVNHWWHVPLYISPRGLTTSGIGRADDQFELELDFIDHVLVIRCSDGFVHRISLEHTTVADFYSQLRETLDSRRIWTRMIPRPYGIPITDPFPTDEKHHTYQKEYVERFWGILRSVKSVFDVYRGEFIGKCSPVHFFWHSFDLAVTRFSGRPAPVSPDADPVTREAYSHEVISCGFWVGDDKMREPAFYLYASPSPDGLASKPLEPASAFWGDLYGGTMALLRYEDVRKSDSAINDIYNFLQSGYTAAADLAGWDRAALERR